MTLGPVLKTGTIHVHNFRVLLSKTVTIFGVTICKS